jgi:TolB protein
MKKLLLICLAILAAGYCFAASAAKLDLNVYASKFDSIPIGVVDFHAAGKTLSSDLPEQVIAGDLDFCGRFYVVSRPTYDSATFAKENVGIYVDGDYTVNGASVTLNCFLHDASNKELIVGKNYHGEAKFVRQMLHRYCDEIVEMLFGDRGIFESKIVLVKSVDQKKNIAIMDFDGRNQRMLTNNNSINIFPTFADSTSIIWDSYLRGKPDLYRGSIIDGTSKIFIHSRFVQTSPDVSRIDGTVAFASSIKGDLDIYTCAPDGSAMRQLTTTRGVDTSPSWSPNGYQIAFTSDRSGNPAIYVMDADGANQRRVSFASSYADAPAWCPKGDKIAFQCMNAASKFDIWVVGPDGTQERQITTMPGNNEYPTWSPDGALIAFVNTQGGKSDLYVVKASGASVRRVTFSGDVRMPDWSKF